MNRQPDYPNRNIPIPVSLDASGIMRMVQPAMLTRLSNPWELLRRWMAAGNIGVVLALGIFAANPELHGELHGSHDGSDEGCAVVLFAGGVALAVGATALRLPAIKWISLPAPAIAPLALEAPRYLLQPERGPPVY